MNQLSSTTAWPVVKQKLKERYQHLTDADLEAIENGDDGGLESLRRTLGRSFFEIVRLVEEITEDQGREGNPLWLAFARSEEWRSRHWCGGAIND
jgi:hypothetical protein